MQIREAYGVKDKFWKPVKSHEEAVKEGRSRIEKSFNELTHSEIAETLQKETVVQKVTPLAHHPYSS